MARPDVTPRAVAVKWLDGWTYDMIEQYYGIVHATISRRLKAAREECPDLPWDERKKPETRPRAESPVKDFLKLNDGISGGTNVPAYGSLIRGRGLKNR